jgi:hypothetical protein
MPRLTTKRSIAISTVALVIVAAAIAYFTSIGSGTGTASGGNSQAVTLHATVSQSLYPGTSSPVSFTVDNPSTGHQRVGTVHLASIAADAGHSTCNTADFSMPDVVANQDFGSGNGQAVTAGGTLSMANTGVSQDACQGATLTLNLTSN